MARVQHTEGFTDAVLGVVANWRGLGLETLAAAVAAMGADTSATITADNVVVTPAIEGGVNVLAVLTALEANKSAVGHTHAASAITYTPAGGVASTNVQGALAELGTGKAATVHGHAITDVAGLQGALDAKVSVGTVYSAGAISNAPAGGIAATTVQAALNELDSEKSAVGHTHAASAITVTPSGGITSTNTQAALSELDAKKAAVAHTHVVADVSGLQTALDGKAPVAHTHAASVLTVTPTSDMPETDVQSALANKVAKSSGTLAQGRASILDFIPAPYHAPIQARTGTVGSYDVAAAFALAMADPQCGGMHVPWGLYNLASMATINKPFSLIGHGGDYQPTPTGTVFRVAQDVIGIKADADSIEMRGLVLDGSAGGGTPDCKGGIGVWFTFQNKAVVHNCYGVFFRLTPFYLDGAQNCDFQSLGCYYSPINFLVGGNTRNLFLSKSTLLNLVGIDPAYVVSRYGNNRNLFAGHLPSGGLLTYLTSTLGLTQLDDTSELHYPSKLHVIDTISEGPFNEAANFEIRGFYDNIHLRGLELTEAGAGGFLLKVSQPGPAVGTVILDGPTFLTNQGTVGLQPGYVSADANAPVVVRGPVYTNLHAPVRGANVRLEYDAEDQPPYRATLNGSRRLVDGVGGWTAAGGTVAFDGTNQRVNFTLANAAVGAQCGGSYRGFFPAAVKANLPGRVTGYCSAWSANIGVYATRVDSAPFQTLVGTITGTGPFTFDYVVGGAYDGGLRLIPESGTNVTVSLSDLFNGWMV